MQGLRTLVASDGFRGTILFLIVINAFALGMEATPDAATRHATLLDWVFLISQVVFVAEILARWLAAGRRFFADSWNRFDFTLVALSLLPAIGAFALLGRIFRVLRVLRVVSVGQVLWGSLLREDAGLRAGVLALLLTSLSLYVFALLGFHLIGGSLPGWDSLSLAIRSLARALTPSGIVAAWRGSGWVLLFLGLFYLSLLSIAVNLAVSLMRTSRGPTFLEVKRPGLLLTGALLTLPFAYWLVDRIDFVRSSHKAVATVAHVEAENDRCGRRFSRRCTRFHADLSYHVAGKEYWLRVSAGRARGHDRLVQHAQYRIKQLVYVIYDARDPNRVYVDTLWNVWDLPLMALFGQIAAFIGCLRERFLEPVRVPLFQRSTL